MKKFNSLLILFIFFFTSCQSIKDGLSGQKSENSDEFLVEKKNPLVTPPNFLELPEPSYQSNKEEIKNLEENINIQKILNLSKNSKSTNSKSDSSEDFILNQIKKK